MNGDIGVPWLLSPIWMALAGGIVPALIAAFKRRAMTVWYLYGFACTLVAWPLLAQFVGTRIVILNERPYRQP